jgi:carboxylesterase type B
VYKIFGFLASSHLNKDQTNLGLRDQEFVFRWVHKHILLFGGDPQSIVAYGQSAGAISVATHMMRNTQPYFHKAILHSGGPGLFMPPNLDTFYNIVLQKTGCVTLDCLRGRDAQELYLLSIGVQFFPYIDGSFIKERPKTLFARKQVWDIPVMINTVAKEGQLFTRSVIDDTMALGFVNAQFGFLNSVQKEELFRLYPRKEFSTPSEWVGEMYGDAGFTCPAWMVHQYMKQSFRTYFDLNGSLHGSDLPYFWDYKPQVVDKNLSNRMMNLLDRFVNNQKLKEFRNKDTLSLVTMKLVKDEDKAKKCRFWTNV